MRIWRFDFWPSMDYYRPSIWFERRRNGEPHGYYVLFLGWQKPSLLKL